MTPAALAAVVFFAVSGPTVAPSHDETPAAQAPPPAPAPTPSVAAPPAEASAEKKSPFEISGRVVARETFGPAGLREGQRDPWTGRFSLANARIGAKYRMDDVLVEVEAELADEPRLRDAYIRLDTGYGTALRAGQFKSPFAIIAMESTWTLPTIERGRIDDLLVDRLQVGGRRPGAQIEWAGREGLRPRIEAGIWQGTDQDGNPREDRTAETLGETAGARFSVRPGPLELGLSGAWRVAQPVPETDFERFWTTGADLTLATDGRGRAWVEGGAGSSWADENPADDEHAIFGYGRTIAAWRIGGASRGAPYLEAFGSTGALDPDLQVKNDLVIENAIGFNAGRWKRWRGQVQLESSRASRNTPASLLGDTPKESRAVLLQIGVAI